MSLREDINFLVSQVLLEIRSNFKWDEFKKIDGLTNKAIYLSKTGTEVLGEGSARIVYLLSNRYVLKLAQPSSPKRGMAQNKYEAELATDPDFKPVIAQVYDFADDYSWMVSELVRPLKNQKEFETLTGVPFMHLFKLLSVVFEGKLEETLDHLRKQRDSYKKEIRELDKESPTYNGDLQFLVRHLKYIQEEFQIFAELPEKPFVKAVLDLVENKGSMIADMKVIDHWGKTADGRVVLLDYGYSREVARDHYGVSWV